MKALLLIFFALAGYAQDESVFRADVSLVHVDASVVAQDGRILTGFSQRDFRVFDNDREMPITAFATEEQPLDLIILFDISGSMGHQVAGVASAARTGLAELRRGDRVAIMVFNSRARVIAPFTEDLRAVERSITEDVLQQRFRGGTLIQEAVFSAAHAFNGHPSADRRRAILIITDNIGVRTRREQTVVRDLWEADAILSGLILRDAGTRALDITTTVISPQTRLMRAGMKGIAEKTGGEAIESSDPGSAFRDMMHRIRSRYSLYYSLPPDQRGRQHTVRVELSAGAKDRNTGARVHSRRGYLSPETR